MRLTEQMKFATGEIIFHRTVAEPVVLQAIDKIHMITARVCQRVLADPSYRIRRENRVTR